MLSSALPSSWRRQRSVTPTSTRFAATISKPAGRVERLLEAHSQAGSFLAARPALPATTDLPAESSGTVIGPYKLLEPIGEGGMGAVWMAEQNRPVQRLVALKLIKPGMDYRQSWPGSRPSGRRWR